MHALSSSSLVSVVLGLSTYERGCIVSDNVLALNGPDSLAMAGGLTAGVLRLMAPFILPPGSSTSLRARHFSSLRAYWSLGGLVVCIVRRYRWSPMRHASYHLLHGGCAL
ncbi:hypothetical protein C8Q73DRAFT_718819 [Cubamyces lactineus]|nr:hypothetical protein C8Q73DRAFT_718819 [Cubamyces lactineus]